MVYLLNEFSTEIRTFYSLKEIRESVEEEMKQLGDLSEDYSEWLGTLLRNPDSTKGDDWTKKAANLQKAFKAGRKKGGKQKAKLNPLTEWIQFKDLMLCSDNLGEAEILFEAVEELKDKIDNLEKAKSSIEDLERYGLGNDMSYTAYIKNGVPQKIVIKPREGSTASERFEFTADFSITKQA